MLVLNILVTLTASAYGQSSHQASNQVKLSTPEIDSLFIAFHQEALSHQGKSELPYFLIADIYDGAEGVRRVQFGLEHNIGLRQGAIISFFKLNGIICLIRIKSMSGIIAGHTALFESFIKEHLPGQYRIHFGEPEMFIIDGDTLWGKTETVVLGKRYVWDVTFRAGRVIDVRKRFE